jgi:hypothetical protein
MAVVGVRQDLTYKVLDQVVITDDTGAIVYNLPQQDMLALRVGARFGFAIAKPVSRNASGAGGFPFAVLNQGPLSPVPRLSGPARYGRSGRSTTSRFVSSITPASRSSQVLFAGGHEVLRAEPGAEHATPLLTAPPRPRTVLRRMDRPTPVWAPAPRAGA